MAAPAHHQPTVAGQPGPRSDMQKDMDGWMEKLNHAAKDHRTITQAPGEAPWTNNFFSCFSPADTCFVTCCCPCVTFGKTHHRLQNNGDLSTYSPLNFSCLGWYLSTYCCLHVVGNIMQRHDIRQRAEPKLQGNFVTDLLKAWCCNCCDLIQQDKEAEALIARQPTVMHQPALKQDGMQYAAPQQDSMHYAPPTQ